MSWKEFLRPDWKKVLVFAMIWLLPFVVFLYLIIFMCPICPTWGCGYTLPFYCKSNFSNNIGFYFLPLNGIPMTGIMGLAIPIAASVILFYLISCLIVWIYDKIRKKK